MSELYMVRRPPEIPGEQYEILYQCCSEGRKRKASDYVFVKDREISALTECFARYCIGQKYRIPMTSLDFGTEYYGKPFVKNREEIQFNLSHSGEYIVCGISQGAIGVDIEEIKKAPLEVAESYFSEGEKNELRKLTGREADRYFFLLWTLKESYLKMTGNGLKDIAQCAFEANIKNFKVNCYIEGQLSKDYMFTLLEHKGYIIASCSKDRAVVKECSYEQVISGIVGSSHKL